MKKIYIIILVILTIIVTYRFVDLRYNKHNYYLDEYNKINNKTIYDINQNRGKILDRNGIVLVDNIGINTIIYRNINNLDIDILANKLTKIITDIEPATIVEQQNYLLDHTKLTDYLTDDEIKQYNDRLINKDQIEQIIKSRMNIDYTLEEKIMIKLYTLLNNGYSYDYKIIKENATDKECAIVSELNIKDITCTKKETRNYKYDTLKTILGTTGKITKDNKNYYLENGYNINDEVGISYLEKEYDSYLKGTKTKYKINKDNSLEVIEQGRKGNDIYLSVDIKLQEQINEIIKNNIELSKTLKNTEYYNTSYVIVSNPNTGEIIASTGLSNINDEYYDVTTNILTNSFTVGSVVKGASHTVAYQNNLIELDKKINDSCVKLYGVPTKCSYKRLGMIDDITALKTSSNYYQFINAIKLTGNNYTYNIKLDVNESHFNTYRDTFKQFGLGSSTGIDLENESIGIKGNIISPDLLLNLAIGQYDTYTPLQLTNYINTIATKGKRYSLHYLNKINDNDKTIYTYEPKILNEFNDNWYFNRIEEGFKEVLYNGTGRGYTDTLYKPAGKTGTSEVVYNKDITTINQTYIMYAPYDNPKYSIVVISPNISYNNENNNYIAPINRYISKEVSKIIFEK